jgi:radical SAM superfamily enzyme YgiQ (UPF0313 family)
MARILFVVKELKMEPLGIMYLSAALKKAGHEVQLARYDYGTSPEEIVMNWRPDWLAYSVCSGLEGFYRKVDYVLREAAASVGYLARPMCGGPACTFQPFGRSMYLGTEFRGESEHDVVRYLAGESFSAGHAMIVPDLSALPWADREIIYQFDDLRSNPIKNVITRRGCKYACSYCFNREWNRLLRKQLPRGIVRYRLAGGVTAECRELRDKWPLKMINFVDDNFIDNWQWLYQFAHVYKRSVGTPFFCSARPDDMSEDKMGLLAYAGCSCLNLALESANDENRREVLTRGGKKEAVIRTIELAKKYGIRTRLQNIIGLPVDDPMADALETLDFNIRAQPTSSWCSIMQAYKGTRIYEIAKKRGMTPDDDSVDHGFFGVSTLKIRDKRKIERLHKLWHLIVRWPWLKKLAMTLIKLPIPFSVFRFVFKHTKKWLAEKEYWWVLKKK